MLDRMVLAWLAPTVQRLAGALVRRGVSADAVTLAGAAVGLSGSGWWRWGIRWPGCC